MMKYQYTGSIKAVSLITLLLSISVACTHQDDQKSTDAHEQEVAREAILKDIEKVMNIASDSTNMRLFDQQGNEMVAYIDQKKVEEGIYYVKEVQNIFLNEAEESLETTVMEYAIQTKEQSQRYPVMEHTYYQDADTAYTIKRPLTEFLLDTVYTVPQEGEGATTIYHFQIYDLMFGPGQYEAIYQKFWHPELGTIALSTNKEVVMTLTNVGGRQDTSHLYLLSWLYDQQLLTP